MTNAPANRAPIGLVKREYTPEEVEAARARAEQVKDELRKEGFEAGLSHAHHASIWKSVAFLAAGVLIGAFGMGWYASQLSESATFTAGAVVDRVLLRTQTPREQTAPPPLTVHYAQQHPCRANERPMQPGLPCPGP